MQEQVNHPSHYNQGKIEVIDYIEDKDFNFHLGNAIKYISRAGKKDKTKTVEDLEKAIWYIKRYIETLKPTEERRRPNDMNSKNAARFKRGDIVKIITNDQHFGKLTSITEVNYDLRLDSYLYTVESGFNYSEVSLQFIKRFEDTNG